MNYFLFSLLISYVTGQSLICLRLGAPPSSWVGGQSWGCENEYNYLGTSKTKEQQVRAGHFLQHLFSITIQHPYQKPAYVINPADR